MGWRRRTGGIGIALLSSLFLNAAASRAQSPISDFYRGKTLTIVVGLPPGGGFDLYARLIGRHLSARVPGQPAVVVQNMPGAGSLLAGAYVYNIAPQDGTVIGAPSPNLPVQPLVDSTGIKYDPLKFQWLPTPTESPTALFVWDTSPVRSVEDLRQRETTMGAVAAGSPPTIGIYLYNEVLKTRMRPVVGYAGLPAAVLAIERGELEGYPTVPLENLRTSLRHVYESGRMRILLQSGDVRVAELPDVPTAQELVAEPHDRALLKLGGNFISTTVPYMLGPGVPAERVAALRQAFLDMFADPAFRDDAERQNIRLRPISAEQMTQRIRDAYDTDPAVVARLRAVFERSR